MITTTDAYALMFAAGAMLAIVFPEETYLTCMKISLEIELMLLNWKMRRMQWKLYKQLCKDAKTLGLPEPPPFKFVRLQDRGKK